MFDPSNETHFNYGKGDTYLELDELAQASDENEGTLIELNDPQPSVDHHQAPSAGY